MSDKSFVQRPFRGKDLTGLKFGRWTVVGLHGFSCVPSEPNHFKPFWDCLCECKNSGIISGYAITSGHSVSCGCYNAEVNSKRSRKHGGSNNAGAKPQHPLYGIWCGMRARCLHNWHKNYKSYGGRGIAICERWSDFAKFLEDMQPAWTKGMTLERKNNNGNYEPSNCRWATRFEQAQNTRRNVFITASGETLTKSQWSRKLGISHQKLDALLAKGFTIDQLSAR